MLITLNYCKMQIINCQDIHNHVTEDLEIFLFNVGQGDHILLKFPGQEYGIIDFHFDLELNIVEPPSLSYFRELKNSLSKDDFEKISISFICMSHTDSDHIKGVSEVVDWFNTENIHN